MKINLFLIKQILIIAEKDFSVGLRRRAAFAAMAMFSLTTIAALSLSMRGAAVETNFLAAILWIIIFFAASAGISETFDDESSKGTLQTLKIYAEPQAILFGKIFFTFISLFALIIFILPIFFILFDCEIVQIGIFLPTILLGIVGISVAGTLTAAITESASTKNGLFPILLFPIILPIFLPIIRLTEISFSKINFDAQFLILSAIYDAILIVSASILYDYLD